MIALGQVGEALTLYSLVSRGPELIYRAANFGLPSEEDRRAASNARAYANLPAASLPPDVLAQLEGERERIEGGGAPGSRTAIWIGAALALAAVAGAAIWITRRK